MKWTDDVYAEQILERYGLKWDVEDVQFSKIDWEASRQNRARLGTPVDQTLVLDIASAVKLGASLPMPVLRKVGSKYIIQGGNHRCPAAKEAGESAATAYVIESDDSIIIKTLPQSLNPGVRAASHDDRIRMAIDCVKNGMKPDVAALNLTISKSCLTDALRANALRAELRKMGAPEDRLSDTTVNKIGTIRNLPAMVAVARHAVSAKLVGVELADLINRVKNEDTEAMMISVVAASEKNIGITTSPVAVTAKNGRPKSTAFKMALASLERTIANARSLDSIGITTAPEKAAVAARARSVIKRLQEILK